MRVYTIYLRQYSPSLECDAIVVREGFCWMAFFAAPLWALTCRMWFTSLGVLATYALVILAAFILKFDQITTMAIVFGTSSIVGFCANDWRRMALVSRGWQTKGVAAAVDKDAALRRFIDLHPDVFHQPGNTPTY